jgi:hypothetical protein
MHFGGRGAGQRPRLPVGRPDVDIRVGLGEVLDDGDGFGDDNFAFPVGDLASRLLRQPLPLSGANSASKGSSKCVRTSQGRMDQLE